MHKPAFRRRAAAVSVLVALAAAGLVGCSSKPPGLGSTSSTECPAKPSGALCIRVVADHATVDDVVGYLSSSESTLGAKTWRLVLTTYGCDPGQGVRSKCGPSATYA